MKTDDSRPTPNDDPQRRSRWPWILAAASVLVVVVALLQRANNGEQSTRPIRIEAPEQVAIAASSRATRVHQPLRPPSFGPGPTAQEIVASKVVQFGKNRRKLVHTLAKHFKVEVPNDVERFFDAVESGRWEEIDAAHRALLLDENNLNQPRSAELHQIWRPIQETWGAAREAHDWPAQKLLDYGEGVLGSLRPGMIYAGGTDPGCFIPTMLNDTSDGERRIVLTQNALADNTYLNYLSFLYGDQMATLTKDDSEYAFQEYLADAQKRVQHDQQFPNEPKQVKPGEDIKMIDNRVQVSGQVAVMAINEKLFQMLMEKNPDASFAIEQSFPFASMYTSATPLGPIMELRVQDQQNALTAERAAQSVDYWRATAQQLLADPETPDGSNPRKAYSKMAAEQSDLLLNRKYTAEAEQALQLANQICPSSPEAVFRYANLLVAQKRFDDAIVIANNAIKTEPANKQFRDLLNNLNNAKNN
jgi:tetratricopeptide (TPR) repeat protein